MVARFRAITSVRSLDADNRRRGRNLIILALGMAALAITFIPVALGQGNAQLTLPLLCGAAILFTGIAYLGRLGIVAPGAWTLIGVTITGTLASMTLSPESASTSSTPFFLVLAILLAGVLLPPAQIWSVMVICLIGLAATTGVLTVDLADATAVRRGITSSSILLIMVAVISFVSASSVRAALADAEAARRAADEANRALAANNTILEERVEERTETLRRIADEQQIAAAELQASLQAQQELNRLVADLAVPVIPVSAGTLVVPLVGNIDSARAHQVLASILAYVERSGAHTVILDVTGVAVVDTQVAAALLRVAHATRLMGAEAILAGIRPEVAQSLVGLGVDLSDLHTVATLQEAL